MALLLLTYMRCNWVLLHKDSGIDPIMELYDTSIIISDLSDPSVVGRVPVMEL